jgi:DNA polymerase III subunit delta'
MAFRDFSKTQQSVQLLQRSLERGRLAHAYLFSGHDLQSLESIALTLAKTLNCENPIRRSGNAIDCCDRCAICLKIEHQNHPDVHLARPESKSRIITVSQVRDLMREIQLKAKESSFKVALIVATDRLRLEGANAFLKTLEEPPPGSIIILLTTDPQKVLPTLVSRCLRLSFGQTDTCRLDSSQQAWLGTFTELAGAQQKSLLSRYRLLDVLLRKLTGLRTAIEESLAARSPAEEYPDAEKAMVERWEDELAAAVEAEYRRQRADLLGLLQWWLRDVWLRTLGRKTSTLMHDPFGKAPASNQSASEVEPLLTFPELAASGQVAARLSPQQAVENLQILEQLQRWLGSNVQEALALEVGLLKLHL